MEMVSHRALDFLQQAPAMSDIGELVREFGAVVNLYGYDTFGYISLATPGEPVRPRVLFSGQTMGWGERYMQEHLAADDPTLPLVFSKHSPFAWSDLSGAALNKKQKRLFEEAFKVGLKNGFVVPVTGPLGEVAAVLLAGENHNPPGIAERSTIQALATVFATCGRSLLEIADDELIPENILTRREAQCLTWVAQGKTDWEIGAILEIAPRTVGAHLDNARAKLGASTRAQAVFEAWRHGLLIEVVPAKNYGKRPIH